MNTMYWHFCTPYLCFRSLPPCEGAAFSGIQVPRSALFRPPSMTSFPAFEQDILSSPSIILMLLFAFNLDAAMWSVSGEVVSSGMQKHWLLFNIVKGLVGFPPKVWITLLWAANNVDRNLKGLNTISLTVQTNHDQHSFWYSYFSNHSTP